MERSRLYAALSDETYRMMLLFGLATLLGVGSLVSFVFSPGGSPTRTQFGLLLGAMVVVFYLTVWGNTG